MTLGPTILDVSVSYGLPRSGIPAANSFRRWAAAALDGRIREASLPPCGGRAGGARP